MVATDIGDTNLERVHGVRRTATKMLFGIKEQLRALSNPRDMKKAVKYRDMRRLDFPQDVLNGTEFHRQALL